MLDMFIFASLTGAPFIIIIIIIIIITKFSEYVFSWICFLSCV